jgi:hypothetical protein
MTTTTNTPHTTPQQPRRSPEFTAGDRITIEKPNGDRLRREVIAGGRALNLGVWLTPAHWANLETLQRDGWVVTSHDTPTRNKMTTV